VRRYVQTAGPVGEFSALPLLQRAETRDLVFAGYGLLIVALVLASYLMGAFGWLPHDPRQMNVELINAAPFTPGHPLGTDFLGRDLQARLILGIQAYFLPGLLAIAISVVGEAFSASSRATGAAGSARSSPTSPTCSTPSRGWC